jgi:replicative DNA helicase
MSFGKHFLSALIAKGATSQLIHGGSIKHLFKGSEIPLFEFVFSHTKKHAALPQPETILAHTGEELPKAVEPDSYYLDLMKKRHVEYELKKSMSASADHLKALKHDEALGTMTESVLDLVRDQYGTELHDFRDSADILLPTYYAQATGLDKGLSFGWPYLDTMTGGMLPGDIISFVGRPALGKTWQMLYGAHYGWLQAELDKNSPGSPRLFVSMEMKTVPIEQRLAAMHLSIPAFEVKNGLFTDVTFPKYKGGLSELKGFKAPFWVVNGRLTSTVEDIEVLARLLKPAAIFIDGAYLMQNKHSKNRYERVADNLDLLKGLADLAPTVCSWQFNREASKKKKEGEDPALEDIGYSDTIGQHSSLVLGLFESESVETTKTRRVKVLKGRNGETGEFMTNFNFDKMDFSQVEDTSVEKLQFA